MSVLSSFTFIMRHCLTHLVLLFFPFAWTDESANLDLDFDTSADSYYPDDSSYLTSPEPTEWSGSDGDDWSPDGELNPDLFVDASSSDGECQTSADQLQWTINTSRRIRRQDTCPSTFFGTSSSSHDANKEFLDSLPVFTMYKYKEPDPDVCSEEFVAHYIYPICGSSHEEPLEEGSSDEGPLGEGFSDDEPGEGLTIFPCGPCMYAVHPRELRKKSKLALITIC